MRKFSFGILFGLVLMATPADAACTASAARSWVSGLTIEAFAQGPTCAQAVAVISIRKKSGEAVWVQSYITQNVMSFTQPPAANNKQLMATLKDWISGDGFMKTADKLVEGGEFPFTKNDDAETFNRYRKAKSPLFCYIQGMESGNCLTVDKSGAVVELGVQSFPG
jgi:hypothetical protein